MVEETEVEVKSKDFFYRGIKLQDLQALDVREIAKYLSSRSRRSVLRNFQVIEKFVKHCEKLSSSKKKIRTHIRDIVIVPRLVGMNIGVYNGKTFNDILIIPEMIGHKLGEFSLSRSRVNHGKAGIGSTKSSKAQKK